MKLELNPMDYVSQDEIKDSILDGIRSFSRDNAERIISNCGYYVAQAIVDEKLGDDAKEAISEKAMSLIDDLSQFVMFSDGGYGRQSSEARKCLDRAVIENKDALNTAVKKAIHNLSKSEIVGIIKSGKVKMVIE